jgi:hypothetical protein
LVSRNCRAVILLKRALSRVEWRAYSSPPAGLNLQEEEPSRSERRRRSWD